MITKLNCDRTKKSTLLTVAKSKIYSKNPFLEQ